MQSSLLSPLARSLAVTDETLEATRAQNKSLWAENARLREEKANLEVLVNANYARAKELEAQRDTLLAALREIASMEHFDDGDAGMAWDAATRAISEGEGEK